MFQFEFSSDFDEALAKALSAANVPGAAMLTIRDGEIESTRVFGLADPQAGIPVDPNTLFTIASVSKPLTATALMTLFEQGRFKLDDDINLHLPFKVLHPDYPNSTITFRMLLTHTSSIRDSEEFFQHYTLYTKPVLPDSPIPLGEYLRDYLSPENFLRERPGDRYSYSNVGFGLVGYLVERISGIAFDEYCKQAIFEPLGIKQTAWMFKDIDLKQMAVPYGYDSKLRQPIRYGFYGYPTYPDGALKTSVGEFACFLSLFVNEGKTFEGQAFLRPQTVQEMLACRNYPGLMGNSIGLAWHFADGVYHHDGCDPGLSTSAYFKPDTRQAVIFFANGTNFEFSSLMGAGAC